MVSITNDIYKISDTSEDHLKELGFRYDRATSDNDITNYTYKFSVYEYGGKSLLDCVLLVNVGTKLVTVNVYQENGSIYRPFYYTDFGRKDTIVDIINGNVKKEMRKLGIKQVKNKKGKDEYEEI